MLEGDVCATPIEERNGSRDCQTAPLYDSCGKRHIVWVFLLIIIEQSTDTILQHFVLGTSAQTSYFAPVCQ